MVKRTVYESVNPYNTIVTFFMHFLIRLISDFIIDENLHSMSIYIYKIVANPSHGPKFNNGKNLKILFFFIHIMFQS